MHSAGEFPPPECGIFVTLDGFVDARFVIRLNDFVKVLVTATLACSHRPCPLPSTFPGSKISLDSAIG